jgi:hypothetical protein
VRRGVPTASHTRVEGVAARLLSVALLSILGSACASPEAFESTGLALPSCPGDVCTEGVNVDDRFYALMCWGVDPAAVLDDVVASGSGVFEEVRPIAGLPPDLWLAVKGELPCRPASSGPLEYEWYLLENPDMTVDERREHLPVFRSVTTEP